ncbi:hypothetical protein EVAR_40853_1 [Eumeta japonica]|uniref:Uncharacterized protein n=1 Tax=Eumeta variegata TaxID=151549 RepID=A0A4C1X5Y0_EUMVA|nr:hypothetical protein EVAR_40853_1 [Eumeta japonica]
MLQIIAEKPKITYYNPRYISSINMTSRRYSRGDVYYLDLNFELKEPIGNNVSSVFVLYEYRDHAYRQTFVELGFRICDLLLKNKLFWKTGAPGWNTKLPDSTGCLQPREYDSGDGGRAGRLGGVLPKGRVYMNLTMVDHKELMSSGFIDYEFKKMTETSRGRRKNLC